jgi:malate dehydrogenase
MSDVAILGAGPIGAAVAHKLAQRSRVRRVLLVDASANVAAGKALDIRQSGAVDGFDTALVSAGDPLDAVGAEVIVFADQAGGDEWHGDAGLTLLRRIVTAGSRAAFVFAGPKQVWLMETAAAELKVPGDRLIGTAASAVAAAMRAFAGIELNLSGVDLSVVGRPPGFVVGWSAATVAGSLLTDLVPAHRLLALSQSIGRLWPPGPQAIAAPTARVVEALVSGSRERHHAMTIADGELGIRGAAIMLPLELGGGHVLRRIVPSLSPQERTETISSIR